jgi:hypothetical protein
MIEQMEAALEKAKNELSYATHLEECGKNAGIRKMNANKADWLKWVVYLAELGLEHEKMFDGDEAVPDTDESVPVFQQVMALFQSINNSKVSIK